MSCFNEITIGVLTDYKQIDLEKRFQMWGFYLWLDTYKMYTRMICERQGDEDLLNLPVSFRSYYTQQSFQIGKKKMDVCVAIGKHLTASRIDRIKQQGSLVHDDTRIIAYGLEEGRSTGDTQKHGKSITEEWDSTCFDDVLVCCRKAKRSIQEIREEEPVYALNPVLLAESTLYERAVEKQTLCNEPYVMLYSGTGQVELLEKARAYAKKTQRILLVNDRYTPGPDEIVYSEEQLDEFYAVLADAKFLVTDTLLPAELALARALPFTAFPNGEEDELTAFLSKYRISACTGQLPKTDEELAEIRKKLQAAVRRLSKERFKTYFLLEDLFGMTKRVNCPTEIRKSECYGCYACKEVCPVNAIAMIEDEEGFLFPEVDASKCVQCGLCKKICIAREDKQYAADRLDDEQQDYPLAYAATCKSEVQLNTSTSGGVFQSLARYTIEMKHGVVAGARYEENARIVTDIAETMEEAKAFSGSKYARSDISGIFPRIKEYLDGGREVLFTGVPCECAGLRAYLQKEYDNLTVCEIICHGGGSPKLLATYIKHINKKLHANVSRINFRDKQKSWLQKDFKLTFEFDDREPFTVRGRQNNYMNAFINNYIFRISCYRCQYAGKNRSADITIGDCHGIITVNPDMYDKRGVSSVLTTTPKGEALWRLVQDEFVFCRTTPTRAYVKNHRSPSVLTRERAVIFSKLSNAPINSILKKYNDWQDESIN